MICGAREGQNDTLGFLGTGVFHAGKQPGYGGSVVSPPLLKKIQLIMRPIEQALGCTRSRMSVELARLTQRDPG